MIIIGFIIKCGDSVQRAQKVALMARALCDQH